MNKALLDDVHLLGLLRCPVCRNGALTVKDVELVCSGCTSCFPLAGHRPILLRNDNALFSIDDYRKAVPDKHTGQNGWARFVPCPSVILASFRPTIRKLAKVGVRFGFGWIKYLDYFLANRPEAMDSASCTYFMGAKAQVRISDSEIIARYVGAKALRHV